MPLLKTNASWGDIVTAPTVSSLKGPVCMTCGRIVDFNGVVEGYPSEPNAEGTTWCKYLVRHHGAEELRTFNMGSSNWDYADAEQMARRTNWFDPTAFEGLGLGREVKNAADHDGGDQHDGIAKPVLVTK